MYVLLSRRNSKRYVGSTKQSPAERLKQHNYGSNKWTKENGPFDLIYCEEHQTVREARQRERFLKSGVGRKELDDLLKRKKNFKGL